MIPALGQWFSNLSNKHPCPAHVVCLPHLSHLIQLISSLVETVRPEMGMSDIGRHKKCAVLGYLMERFENQCFRGSPDVVI